jgi:hypothetical protein
MFTSVKLIPASSAQTGDRADRLRFTTRVQKEKELHNNQRMIKITAETEL